MTRDFTKDEDAMDQMKRLVTRKPWEGYLLACIYTYVKTYVFIIINIPEIQIIS